MEIAEVGPSWSIFASPQMAQVNFKLVIQKSHSYFTSFPFISYNFTKQTV